jgi:ParB-like chromosome segregation protein Spo0J
MVANRNGESTGLGHLHFAVPDQLEVHPFSLGIYGDDVDEAFVASVREFGIEQPIVVAGDGKTIVAGHRRRRAAIAAGLPEVPIIVRTDLTEDLNIRSAIIEANRQRVKTPEQIGREAQSLLTIELERGVKRRSQALHRGRRSAGPKSDARRTASEDDLEMGRSDDKVAKRLGLGRDTIRKAIVVAQAIDEAGRAGNSQRAEEIRKQKSVHAAYLTACANGESIGAPHHGERQTSLDSKSEPHAQPPNGSVRSGAFAKALDLLSKLSRQIDRIAKARGDQGENYKACDGAWDKLCSAILAWEKSHSAPPPARVNGQHAHGQHERSGYAQIGTTPRKKRN